jgi:hypothetical protein
MSLRIALPVALLTACAVAPEDERFIYFTSPTYACGAAADLGCGLALQPVLVRLDGLEGVAESCVSWDGLTLRLALLPGADDARVAAAAAEVLEGDEQRIPESQAAGIESWFGAACCLDLSLHEAGVIATTLTEGLAEEVPLEAADRDRIETILGEELERAFRQAHAAGGGVDRLWEQLPAVRAAFAQRLDFLEPEQRAAVVAFLEHQVCILDSEEAPCP